MDRHHAIRIAVRGLRGVKRANAVERILKQPALLKRELRRRRGARLHQHPDHNVGANQRITFTVTPEQFIALRDDAANLNVTMSDVIRIRVFGLEQQQQHLEEKCSVSQPTQALNLKCVSAIQK